MHEAAFFPLLSLSYSVTLPRGDQVTSSQCALQIQARVYLLLFVKQNRKKRSDLRLPEILGTVPSTQ